MGTDIGEYIVGAYMKIIKGCDFVDYNVRMPGGGQKGLNEIDVVGFNFKNKKAFLCEVTTHIHGVLYSNNVDTVEKIKSKFKNQRDYARRHIKFFKKNQLEYMFWSPVVPKGVKNKLQKIKGLNLVINQDYTGCIEELKSKAKDLTHDTGNPFFRMLQILEHLR